MTTLARIELRSEREVVASRQLARRTAALLGFDGGDQTRIATATSEIARNAQRYARGGAVTIELDGRTLRIVVRDRGPGIAEIDAIESGRYVSRTGMGLGIVGAQRLVDRFELDTSREGTVVTLEKTVPQRTTLDPALLDRLRSELRVEGPSESGEEVERLQRDLVRALDELHGKQVQLDQLRDELEDTNRGVVALYAELDEHAAALQKASEAKTRFFSSMSHEFRTPLNSILSLSRLLLDRIDGELGEEQEKQVSLIRRSARELSEIVDDLLDLAKVEAGKIEVRPHGFTVGEVFAALRGALKPLVAQATVQLHFEDGSESLALSTDEAKVTQILRNFISNALKYTERGEVRVSAEEPSPGKVRFTVRDTGIGIAPADQQRIFEEFAQIEHTLQRRVKGTGLGLPLSRRLAELLGGEVRVESELGRGSTFFLEIPRVFAEAEGGGS